MLMTPPPSFSPSPTPTSANRQSAQLLSAPGRLGTNAATSTGIGAGTQKLGSAFPGGMPGLSPNPMGQQQQQQMMLMKLLRGS